MAGAVKPVAKSVYVCDDVIHDPQTGKMSLLNLWDVVRVPADMGFPYCLEKICVFAWWRDGLHKVRTRIDIVQASSGNVIRRTSACVLDIAARTSSVFACYRLENCVFPEAGFYYVELFCEDEFVDDQIVQILIPEG